MDSIAEVILENNIDKPLDYLVPKAMQELIKVGHIVKVPLRGVLRTGYVLSLKKEQAAPSILPIETIEDRSIPEELLNLAEWMSKYYCINLSKIFKFLMPISIRENVLPKMQIFLTAQKTKKELLALHQELLLTSASQAKAIEQFLKAQKGLFLTELLEKEISKSVIDALIKKNIISSQKIIKEQSDLLLNEDFFSTKPKTLSLEQENALNSVSQSLQSSRFNVHLLFGVTGSGKTEIYLQAIQQALDMNKGTIMLVPEIALTSQTIERFKARFKEKIAIIHHKRSAGERSKDWQSMLSEEAKIVIGARSAVFSPMPNLGLIIVDEEHDSSYKQQEEAPAYNAKNIAIVRAKIANATVILGSATPSIESYFNAKKNKYILNELTQRPNNSSLAKVHVIDMKTEMQKKGGFTYFSEELLSKIKNRYDLGEQTLLFLNRRGFNTSLICTNCSNVFKCSSCDVALTFHKRENYLSCHLCGFKIATYHQCPSCHSLEHIKYQGFGTEHVEASLHAIFPTIRTLRADRDTTQTKHGHEILFKQFRAGKADVLVGTQMIVKGLHFPSVTLVGILNTDGALNIPDFRSSETVFQLLTQVAGRSGREELQGEVIIQTFMPENETILLAKNQDFKSFYSSEIENRKLFNYPPFTNMIKLVFSSKDESKTAMIAEDFRKILVQNLSSEDTIHPVIACGRAKVKDHFRFQFLIRGKRTLSLCSAIEKTKKQINLGSIHLFIDVDPISTFF
ncbi:MAG: primosomal protein N' [Chlamydiae bacterium]|nr:primosomal protein N' [Chlamydiota bacterium]